MSAQFIGEDNAFEIDPYLVVDAMASYRLGRTTLAVNAKNLTDREYETRGFGRSSVIPADPFALYATVAVAFGR